LNEIKKNKIITMEDLAIKLNEKFKDLNINDNLEDFYNKKVLVLGDGIGNIGGFFSSIGIGAKVTILEGRKFNINIAKLRFKEANLNIKIEQVDLNGDFARFGRFDFIINFGLIEVINDVDNLLSMCSLMSDVIILETLVSDSKDKNYKGYRELDTQGIDNGLKTNCVRPSPFYIEQFLIDQGFSCNRYFDSNLNTDHHIYDWVHKDDKSISESTRRFWVFKRVK
jgi:SAM-dependent methyltransferase